MNASPRTFLHHTALRLSSILLLCAGACVSSQGGIHARMAYSEERGLRIVDVPPGPSERGGLRVGDRIVAIDEQPVDDLAAREIVERLRGRAGTFVRVDVLRDGEVVPLRIERKRYARTTGR